MADPRILETLFRDTFLDGWNTLLVGGAEEPVYRPADGACPRHRLFYREDFFSSALHETAHWCIAGAARRRRVDFGYWYSPDGRTDEQQRAFEQVEVRPQALEWLFSRATGVRFHPSADNLDGDRPGPSPAFLAALEETAAGWCAGGLPPRARRFLEVLVGHFGGGDALDSRCYRGALISGEAA